MKPRILTMICLGLFYAVGCVAREDHEANSATDASIAEQGDGTATVDKAVVVNGLTGTYFNNADFTGRALQRVDATVNFAWGTGSPGSVVGPNTFSARWTGYIKANYSQTYTFYTNSDEGVRLWINGQTIVNKWTAHQLTESSGTISLQAGKAYPIVIDYYENTGVAAMQLRWSSASQAKQIVPQAQLFVSDPNTDQCPSDPNKTVPGLCGCGVADTDSDKDGTPDCKDDCPRDPSKSAAGLCGCGVPEGTCGNTPQCGSDSQCTGGLSCVEGHCSRITTADGNNGLHGYISYTTAGAPQNYDMGMGFYSAAWSLVSEPLANFQVGLPGVWITPANWDATQPLCPEGTLARSWPNTGPTWNILFQTVEGGLGYWAPNRFQYGSPKFSMNGTSQCYDYQIASPGWPFFSSSTPLSDDKLGVAQLSNRLLIPPDGLPFDGKPAGELLGYSWMALPFTPAQGGTYPTGDQSWTCFLNAANFKGPIAYYVPQTWSRMGQLFNYPYVSGRGLDAKPGVMQGGAMEVAAVPVLHGLDANGTDYSKIPQLHFPADGNGNAVIVRDVTYYSKAAMYDAIAAWRTGGQAANTSFAATGSWKSKLSTKSPAYDQASAPITGIDAMVSPTVFDSYAWGLHFTSNTPATNGLFPRYFKKSGSSLVAVAAADVPAKTGLLDKEFPRATTGPAYAASVVGAWASPGPTSGEYTVILRDGSHVTYRWYRFVDQPAFSRLGWSSAQKQALQSLVEKMHAAWTIDRDYMAPPSAGSLVRLDPGLIVTPPQNLSVGYVPIVVRQEKVL